MNDKDLKDEDTPAILIRDRRTHRQAELTCTEIMRILRKRAAAKSRGWRNDSGDSSSNTG